VIKNFFKVRRELTDTIQKFDLNLLKLESNENMDIEMEELRSGDKIKTCFADVSAILEKRKRLCQKLFNSSSNFEFPPAKKIKI